MKTRLDASFAEVRPSPESDRRAAALRRYSRFVGIAKRILPATALALLMLVAVWPRIQGAIDGMHFARLPKIDVSQARQVRMVDPRYTGTDRNNRPFVVTADAASQTPKADDAISLDAPKADLATVGGNWDELTAYVGLYQPQAQQLDLFGNVELYQDKGNALRSDSVTINMAQGTAISHDPVEGDGTFGHIKAQGLRVLDRGETIIFTGHAALDLNSRTKATP
ncbi:MAG: LPS export ABC transporter periplasmic protein LptC [Alphaproteobacteria bacterium]|nr:LPS export ABC transporter periplasmic protein LptC [Alphaproteobacteria bacterium]